MSESLGAKLPSAWFSDNDPCFEDADSAESLDSESDDESSELSEFDESEELEAAMEESSLELHSPSSSKDYSTQNQSPRKRINLNMQVYNDR